MTGGRDWIRLSRKRVSARLPRRCARGRGRKKSEKKSEEEKNEEPRPLFLQNEKKIKRQKNQNSWPWSLHLTIRYASALLRSCTREYASERARERAKKTSGKQQRSKRGLVTMPLSNPKEKRPNFSPRFSTSPPSSFFFFARSTAL